MNPATAFEITYTGAQPDAAQKAANYAAKRLAANRANAQFSTGPRTSEGKQRSSENSLRHGLTALSPLLPQEDRAAFDLHTQQYLDEYQPKGATETQLARDLADIAWRKQRIPALEADLLARAANPTSDEAAIAFDTVDAIRAITALSTHGDRLTRQFHKTLLLLRDIQADRREQELRDMRRCAAAFHLHKLKGMPYSPAADGFVFSDDEIQTFIDRQMRHGQARGTEYLLHYQPEKLIPADPSPRTVATSR